MGKFFENGGIPKEHEEQVQFIQMVEAMYPLQISSLLHAIPNGGDRDVRVAKNLKREGVRKGIPDLCFPVPRNGYHGLYIEMKRRKGGRVEKEQRYYIDMLRSLGYKAEICYGCDEAMQVFNEYLARDKK